MKQPPRGKGQENEREREPWEKTIHFPFKRARVFFGVHITVPFLERERNRFFFCFEYNRKYNFHSFPHCN
jgi:hypothetical protein